MQRGGMAARNSMGVRGRAHTCAECGKSFRSGEDLFMHAEVCLLDAFEMEASAMQTPTGTGGRSGQGVKRAAGEEGVVGKRDASTVMSGDVVSKRANITAGSEGAMQSSGNNATGDQFDDDDVEEDSGEYDPPPELELAEPPVKKYKRTFPIGDDGKQIRPKMECPTCGLVLYRHNFSTHFRIHTGELPFQCSFCDKRFRTSSALTVHTRCHTGERPYECPHCNYCCITKRNLDRHIINNHVKKSGKAGAIRLSREYYTPRPRRVGQSYGATPHLSGLDYGDDLDDDDIDDENLDEAELEEEAGISRANERQFPKTSTQVGQNDSETGLGAAADTALAGDESGSAGGQGSFGRLGAVKTVPILDGPKGVYGDPEAEPEGSSQPTASPNKSAPAQGEKEAANQSTDKQQEQESSS